MIVPGQQRDAVEPLEPVAEGLMVHGVRVIGEAEPVGDRELGIPDQEIEGAMVDAPRLQAVADAADEAVDLQVVGHLAVDAFRRCFRAGRFGRPRPLGFGCQECGEIGDRDDGLPTDRVLRYGEPQGHLQRQDQLQELHGIEVEILVQPRLRSEAVEMRMLHLLAQDGSDGLHEAVASHHRGAVHQSLGHATASASRPSR